MTTTIRGKQLLPSEWGNCSEPCSSTAKHKNTVDTFCYRSNWTVAQRRTEPLKTRRCSPCISAQNIRQRLLTWNQRDNHHDTGHFLKCIMEYLAFLMNNPSTVSLLHGDVCRVAPTGRLHPATDEVRRRSDRVEEVTSQRGCQTLWNTPKPQTESAVDTERRTLKSFNWMQMCGDQKNPTVSSTWSQYYVNELWAVMFRRLKPTDCTDGVVLLSCI